MKASGYERNANDWYVEPEWAVDGLIGVERLFTGCIFDPCCGGGNILKRFEHAGIYAVGNDIVDRGSAIYVQDFFTAENHGLSAISSIVSNPPYDRAQEFIDRALPLVSDRVCVLLRLAFLESQARKEWFKQVPLARVWVSSRRMSMPPGGRPDIKASGGTVAFAWFVFEKQYSDSPKIGWF